MERILDIYLNHDYIGELVQDISGRLQFTYTAAWLNKSGSIPISHSLPLQAQPFTGKACKGFFAGVLPEARKREIIARNLGISAHNDFAMLEYIGGECAGAITFLPKGRPLTNHEHDYRPLSEHALAELMTQLPNRPLLASRDTEVRLSLAGAQDKLAIAIINGEMYLPLHGAASTHIIKPAVERFENMAFNEALCLNLASAVGIPAVPATVKHIENIQCLIVERYDRKNNGEGKLQRIHQEDFCQALGVSPDMKYQHEGGPSLKQCFSLLREISSVPAKDLQCLLDAVIFNYLIGNCDAHSKNFSLLYFPSEMGGQTQLAPLYDLVCTVAYPALSKKMAMKIGKEYSINDISPYNWEKFSEETGLAAVMVKEKVEQLAVKISKALNQMTHPTPCHQVINLIEQRCKKERS